MFANKREEKETIESSQKYANKTIIPVSAGSVSYVLIK